MRSLSCAGSVHDNRLVDGDTLASAPSFSLLSPEARAAVAPHAPLIEVPERTQLAGQGRPGYLFFVIESGRAAVSQDERELRAVAHDIAKRSLRRCSRGAPYQPVAARESTSVVASARHYTFVFSASSVAEPKDVHSLVTDPRCQTSVPFWRSIRSRSATGASELADVTGTGS